MQHHNKFCVQSTIQTLERMQWSAMRGNTIILSVGFHSHRITMIEQSLTFCVQTLKHILFQWSTKVTKCHSFFFFHFHLLLLRLFRMGRRPWFGECWPLGALADLHTRRTRRQLSEAFERLHVHTIDTISGNSPLPLYSTPLSVWCMHMCMWLLLITSCIIQTINHVISSAGGHRFRRFLRAVGVPHHISADIAVLHENYYGISHLRMDANTFRY